MTVGVVRGIVGNVRRSGVMGWASKMQYVVGMEYDTDCKSRRWKRERKNTFRSLAVCAG